MRPLWHVSIFAVQFSQNGTSKRDSGVRATVLEVSMIVSYLARWCVGCAAFVLVGFCFVGLHGTSVLQAAERLNVVVVLVDDLGHADLGCCGSTFFETPHIDALAASGLRFTSGYAACAVCSPTRAALQTGLNPARLGLTDWIRGRFQGGIIRDGRNPTEYVVTPNATIACPPNPLFLDPNAQRSLASLFHEAGYVTGHIGKWHLGQEEQTPQHFGYDTNVAGCDLGQPPSYFDPYESDPARTDYVIPAAVLSRRVKGEYLTDREGDEAVAFVKRNRNAPFFLHLAHYAVHTPLQAKEADIAEFRDKNKQNTSPQKNAVYAAMIRSVDDSLGKLVAALRDENLLDRTVIVFTSDNGGLLGSTSNAPLRSGKGFPYEGGIRVPWIIAGAAIPASERGTTRDVPIVTHDLAPTLLELADVKHNVAFDGVSFAPLLRGDVPMPPRLLVWHYPHYRFEQANDLPPYTILRDGSQKLIRFYATNEKYPNRYELYDLEADPAETKNIAAASRDTVTALEQKMDAELVRFGARMPRPLKQE
ncbi:MAG: sulfatase [Thermoguttaceae bacterium]